MDTPWELHSVNDVQADYVRLPYYYYGAFFLNMLDLDLYTIDLYHYCNDY